MQYELSKKTTLQLQVTQWLWEGLSQATYLGISHATYNMYVLKDLTDDSKRHSGMQSSKQLHLH